MIDRHLAIADHEIVTRIQSGDYALFTSLFRAYWPFLCRFAFSRVNDRDESEEIVAETFARVWERRGEWRIITSVEAYLVAAVRNRAHDHLRNTKRRSTAVALVGDDRVAMGSPAPTPDFAVASQSMSVAMRRRFDSLPARFREVMVLRIQRKLNYDEVAEAIGTTKAAAQQLYSRAARALRECVPELLDD